MAMTAEGNQPFKSAVGGKNPFGRTRVPGLVLTTVIAAGAEAVSRRTTGLSPLLWASIGGIAVGTALRSTDKTTARALEPGIKFSKQRLLRAGIILYGAKLTLQKVKHGHRPCRCRCRRGPLRVTTDSVSRSP